MPGFGSTGGRNAFGGGSQLGSAVPPWAAAMSGAGSAPPNAGQANTSALPGEANVDITSPQGLAGSVGGFLGGAGSLIGGLANLGHEAVGGLAGIINQTPIGIVGKPLGDVAQGAVGIGAGVAGTVAGAAAGAVGNFAGSLSAPGGLAQAYAALPADVRAKYDQKLADSGGPQGFGGPSVMEEAVNGYYADQQMNNPGLFTGSQFGAPAPGETPSLIGLLGGIWGTGQRLVERTIVGGVPGSSTNRLDEIMQLGATDPGQMNAVEAQAFQQFSSGTWTRDQTTDFLSRYPTGLAHDPGLAILGTMATDPYTLAATVISGGAALGARALSYAADVGAMVDASEAAGAAGDVAEAARLADAASSASAAGRLAGASIRGFSPGTAIIKATVPIAQTFAEHPQIVQAFRTIRMFVDPLGAFSSHTAAGVKAVDMMSAMAPISFAAAHGSGWTDLLHFADDFAGEGGQALKDTLTRNLATESMNSATKYAVGQHVETMLARGFGRRLMSTSIDALTQSVREGTLPQDFAMGLKDYVQKNGHFLWNPDDEALLAKGAAAMYDTAGKTEEEWLKAIQGMKNDDMKTLLHALVYGSVTEEYYPALQEALRAGVSLRAVGSAAAAAEEPLSRLTVMRANQFAKQDASSLVRSLVGMSKEELATNLDAYGITGRSVAKHLKLSVEDQIAALEAGGATHEDAVLLAESMKSPTLERNIALVREAQQRFPSLSRVIDLSSGTPLQQSERIQEFIGYLKSRIGAEVADESYLPSRITEQELTKLRVEAPRLGALADRLEGVYQFGFRPKQEFRWSIERDALGRWRSAGDPWVELKSVAANAYQPVHELPRNIAGMPVVGGVAQKATRAIDDVEAAGRQALAKVTSASILENGNQRMIKLLTDPRETGLGKLALSESDAHTFVKNLRAGAQVFEKTARALKETDIWQLVERSIPVGAQAKGFGPREALMVVMRGDEGDMRYMGLANVLSGKIKTQLAKTLGQNNLEGQVTQDMYVLLKFRLKAAFQIQQKVTAPVFLTMRGLFPALGTKMTEVDRITQRVVQNMAETSLKAIGDQLNQIEYGTNGMLGKSLAEIAQQAKDPTTVWGKLRTAGAGFVNVKGADQLNYLRAVAGHMGEELRRVHPDVFDENGKLVDGFSLWKQQQVVAAGRTMSDDEAAMRILGDRIWNNNVTVNNVVRNSGDYNFARSIRNVFEHLPVDVGSQHPLDLDGMAKELNLSIGDQLVGRTRATKAIQLKAGLASGDLQMKTITDALEARDLPAQYISRVKNALEFSYRGWWQSAADKYGLSAPQVRALQDVFEKAAASRGMETVDYMSQLLSRTIGGDIENFTVDDLADHVALLQAPKGATSEDLINQLVKVWAHHADPSGQAMLAKAFVGEAGAGADWTEGFAREVEQRIASGAVSANPQVEAAVRDFATFAQDPLKALAASTGKSGADLLESLAVIPKEGAAAFNPDEDRVIGAYINALKAHMEDAHTLVFFNSNRRLIDRATNHPFLGIYPSSFMYGKTLPEFAKFIALRPFGLRTGAVAYALQDMQMALGAQRAYDPSFEKFMESVGGNPLVWLLGYLMPGVPWDINANAPKWVRDAATQGSDNQARVNAGLPAKPFDIGKILNDTSDYINPLVQTEKSAGDLKQVAGMATGALPQTGSSGGSATPNLSGPILGTSLPPIMEQQLQNLSGVLSNQ